MKYREMVRDQFSQESEKRQPMGPHCQRCGIVGPINRVVYPNNGVLVAAKICNECIDDVQRAAKKLMTGHEISGPTLEQAIAGDFERVAAGRKDGTLVGRPFINRQQTQLAYLHRRGWIGNNEYVAGDQYRTIWLRAGLASRVSSAYGGGSGGSESTYGMPASEVVAHNRRLLREARRAINMALARIASVGNEKIIDASVGFGWFEMVAIEDQTRIEVGYAVGAVSRSSAKRTGKKVIDKCLAALVGHFHVGARERWGGPVQKWEMDGGPDEKSRAVAAAKAAEERAKAAGD